MIKFFYKLFSTGVLLLAIISLINALYYYQIRKFFTPGEEIQSVFLGDSHFQNGINDELIGHSMNLATSAEAMIYSRIKLEYLLDNSSSIENVFLSINPSTFQGSIDFSWISNEENYLAKIASYYPIFKRRDIYDWKSQIVNYDLLLILHKITWQSIYSIERQIIVRKLPFVGGYSPNNKEFETDQVSSIDLADVNAFKISENQRCEFLKIKQLCEKEGVSLILINTPIYGTKADSDFTIEQGISELFTDVILWDYSDLLNSTIYFADKSHLNPIGAERLSNYINDSIIQSSIKKITNISADGF